MNAEQALEADEDENGRFANQSASFNCCHCGAYAQHFWGRPMGLGGYTGRSTQFVRQVSQPGFVFAGCTACSSETIFLDGVVIYPRVILAPTPHPDLPKELAADFEEARQISSLSPRGAAALWRLVIQKLCPLIGAKEGPIDRMIGQLVKEGKIPAVVQQAMDSVRVWGNEAVHPGTLDLRDDAEMTTRLFGLVNFVVEKAISDPRQIAEIFGGLPQGKLDGIERRDGKA
jgi:hypothetical protein